MATEDLQAAIDNVVERLGDGSYSHLVKSVTAPLLQELQRLDAKVQALQQQIDTIKQGQ